MFLFRNEKHCCRPGRGFQKEQQTNTAQRRAGILCGHSVAARAHHEQVTTRKEAFRARGPRCLAHYFLIENDRLVRVALFPTLPRPWEPERLWGRLATQWDCHTPAAAFISVLVDSVQGVLFIFLCLKVSKMLFMFGNTFIAISSPTYYFIHLYHFFSFLFY